MELAGPQRDRSVLVADKVARRRANTGQPCGKLLRIADRGREQEQSGLGGAEDDRFFPDDPTLRVAQELALIDDDEPKGIQPDIDLAPRRVLEEVTKYFRRHDQDRRGGVVAPVAGDDADELRPEDLAELGVFRVRQGLERRSIDDSPVLVHGAAVWLPADRGPVTDPRGAVEQGC